jgi:DNA end-binding protein Ku
VGIAKVVIKTRQHLAAVKPKEDALVLELMHFPDEVLEPAGLDLPREEKLGKKEMDMAKSLVETMSGEWNPAGFKDEYREKLKYLLAGPGKSQFSELADRVPESGQVRDRPLVQISIIVAASLSHEAIHG